MEIHIHVPPFLHPTVELLGVCWTHLHRWSDQTSVLYQTLRTQIHDLWSLPYSNVLLPATGVILIFWPILVSGLLALAAAWAWIFWLMTSLVIGVVQLGYVLYQFVMIAVDIWSLSTLKTYTIVRNQCLSLYDRQVNSSSDSKGRGRKSRRRQWRSDIRACEEYESFLKLRIDAKDHSKTEAAQAMAQDKQHDAALPQRNQMRRSSSFSAIDENSPLRDAATTSLLSMKRNRSFSGDIMRENVTVTHDPAVVQELGQTKADLLVTTTRRLEEARLATQDDPSDEQASSVLKYLLAAVVKRNHLKLDDVLIENARSIADSGRYGISAPTRQMIRAYYEEVEKGLDWVVEAPMRQPSIDDGLDLDKPTELGERMRLVRKMKQNIGRTALMLSGGGAQAMYHLGVIRALIESKQYDDIKVISGTSGGSISAGMCAICTAEELFADVCVSTVSTDYGLNGEMKKQNIRWFPPMLDMAAYWMKNKLLVDSAFFQRTCDFYFKDYTFEEAFLRTGKHVCISVSASRSATSQRLLLNHISTPHVTVASAVRASCALPGVMAPAKLIVKNSNGSLEPFEVDGVEWIDGSVQADLPFQRIATLFAVTSFIVSQTNFHVVPFLNKEHHPSQKSMYWRLFQTIEWDIRNRALKLSRLGLFPRIFGQDISKIFKQKYHGKLTIVPRFTTMQTFGLKALSNPTVKDMEGYLKYSQIATWPYLNAIRDMLGLEKTLDDCLMRLEARMRSMNLDVEWSHHDDIESIATNSLAGGGGGSHSTAPHRVRIVGRTPGGFVRDRDSERLLRNKVGGLERENDELRHELERLRTQMANSHAAGEQASTEVSSAEASCEDDDGGDKNEADTTVDPVNSPALESPSQLSAVLSQESEGAIWNLVRGAPS